MRADSGLKLNCAKGLGDVIIRTGIEQQDLFAIGMARGQYDNRHRTPFPDLATHVDSLHVWKAEVQDDERWTLCRGRVDSIPARGCFYNACIPFKRVFYNAPNLRLIVDNENYIRGHVVRTVSCPRGTEQSQRSMR